AGAAAGLLAERLSQPSVSVYRVDVESRELVLLARSGTGAAQGDAPGTRLRPGPGPLARALATGTTQKTLNAYVEPDFVRSLPGETRSEVAVPVRDGETVVGIVQLVYAGAARPQEADIEVAEGVAETIVRALQRGRHGEGEDGVAAVARAMASRLAGSDNLPGAMQTLVEGAQRLTGSTGALLLFRHGSRQALELAAAAGEVPE